MNNKQPRFKTCGLWDFDYKCIPLYNRIPKNLLNKN